MKCQNCGVRDASVRYSQNINGRKAEVCLCSECANELGILNNLSSGFDFGFEKFNNMFSNKNLFLVETPMYDLKFLLQRIYKERVQESINEIITNKFRKRT